MFAVIFEVVPKPERKDEYLELGKFLRPEIEKIDGFMDNERFASQRSQGRVLSLSTWRDEKAVIRWRTLAVHHKVQEKGRFEVFQDYHLRVGEFTADNQLPAGQKLLQQRLDETEVGDARFVTISELPGVGEKSATDDLVGELGAPRSARRGCWTTIYTKASTTPGSCCCWARGVTRGRPAIGRRGRLGAVRCGTGRFASCGITACSIGVRRRNTIRTCGAEPHASEGSGAGMAGTSGTA